MRDPHVVSLRYRLVPGETVSFDRPPPVERENEAFHMRLEDGIVTFEMIEHHASKETAKKRVEKYLQAWKLHVNLDFGPGKMHFEFEGADVVDRDPPPPGISQVIYPEGIPSAEALGMPTIHVTWREYPDPPKGFVVSDDVETMWDRYEEYLEGREPLPGMAYACKTRLEASAGRLEEAARQYSVKEDVLRTLGRLTSSVGGKQTARKFKGLSEPRAHTGAEKAWIEAAVKALIRRAGEWAFDPEAPRPQITMSDLPKL